MDASAPARAPAPAPHHGRRRAQPDRIAAGAAAPAHRRRRAHRAPAPLPRTVTKILTPSDYNHSLELPRKVTEMIQRERIIHANHIWITLNRRPFHVRIGQDEPYLSGYRRSRISESSWSKVVHEAQLEVGDELSFSVRYNRQVNLECLRFKDEDCVDCEDVFLLAA